MLQMMDCSRSRIGSRIWTACPLQPFINWFHREPREWQSRPLFHRHGRSIAVFDQEEKETACIKSSEPMDRLMVQRQRNKCESGSPLAAPTDRAWPKPKGLRSGHDCPVSLNSRMLWLQ